MFKLKELIRKHSELIIYIIIGILTTIINFVVYVVFTRLVGINEYISNIIAWIIAVAYAFVANKFVVFKSNNKTLKVVLKEAVSFVSMRIISLGFDMIILYLVIDVIGWSDLIAKLLSQVVVTVSNYIFSKKIIFKKKDNTVKIPSE